MWILLLLGLLILVLGIFLIWRSRRLAESMGLPAGEIVYADTGAWEAVSQPLLSRRYGVVGRPDYLVRTRAGGRELVIPVEVKSGRRPAHPAEGHILQLAAYCLLVEDIYKVAPPYGLLHYRDATLKIPYSDGLRREVLAAAEDLRQARRAPDVPRSHNQPGRCRGCGYRGACGDEAL